MMTNLKAVWQALCDEYNSKYEQRTVTAIKTQIRKLMQMAKDIILMFY